MGEEREVGQIGVTFEESASLDRGGVVSGDQGENLEGIFCCGVSKLPTGSSE